jgi:hypothetical protein
MVSTPVRAKPHYPRCDYGTHWHRLAAASVKYASSRNAVGFAWAEERARQDIADEDAEACDPALFLSADWRSRLVEPHALIKWRRRAILDGISIASKTSVGEKEYRLRMNDRA